MAESGRRRLTRNQMWGKLHRGFKSLSLRHTELVQRNGGPGFAARGGKRGLILKDANKNEQRLLAPCREKTAAAGRDASAVGRDVRARLKEHDWKSCRGSKASSGVQIPLSPPHPAKRAVQRRAAFPARGYEISGSSRWRSTYCDASTRFVTMTTKEDRALCDRSLRTPPGPEGSNGKEILLGAAVQPGLLFFLAP